MTALANAAPRTRARPDRVPTDAARPRLEVLDRSDDRRRRRRLVLLAGGGAAVLITLLAVLYLQIVMLQRQRQLDSLARERTEVVRDYQDLRRSVAELESPEAVVSRATNELGMVPAPEVVYLEPAPAATPTEPVDRSLGQLPPDETVPADGTVPADEAVTPEATDAGVGG